jgi:hypothetical protein
VAEGETYAVAAGIPVPFSRSLTTFAVSLLAGGRQRFGSFSLPLASAAA